MNARQILTVTGLVAALAFPAIAETFEDDFSGHAPGSDASPAWEAQAFGWAVEEGGLAARGVSGPIVWKAAHFARVATVEAVVRALPTEATQDWKTAGIAIQRDARNAWRLNLAIQPTPAGGKHFSEMHEMLDGEWLAEGLEGSRLDSVEIWEAPGWAWQAETAYRMRIELTRDEVRGTIETPDGEDLARYAWRLNAGAVSAGWAALHSGGLDAVYESVTLEVLEEEEPPVPETVVFPPYEPLSPDAAPVAEGTGFFRVEEIDGRWWAVDPTGRTEFMVGTDHCNHQVHWCEKLGYAPYARNLRDIYPDMDAWAETATDRLRAWNFNLLGANNSPETRYRGLAYTEFASLGSGFARTSWIAEPIHWTGFPDVFDPRFEGYCRFRARELTQPHLGDPWLFGYFIDNELEWFGKAGCLVDDVFKLSADRPAKQVLVEFLRERYPDIASLNRAFGAEYASFDALAASTEPPRPSDALAVLRDEFLAVIAERYFAVTCNALKEADPDHLIIGSRFAGRTPDPVLDACARHLDVFTINTYPRVDMDSEVVLDTPAMLVGLYETMGLPMMITEWSFPALDAGLPCTAGAGMRVDTQEQKAHCYDIFATLIAKLPFMVGYDYFMWVDEPAEGISSTFPEDSNYGLVDLHDKPWETLVARATEVNARVARVHAETPLDTTWATEVAPAPLPPSLGPEELGTTASPSASFEWDLGPIQAAHEAGSGAALSSIRVGDYSLGTLTPLLHLVRPGANSWVRTEREESVATWRAGGIRGADLVLAHDGDDAFRIGYRVAAADGMPWALARVLWIENAGAEPLEVGEYFHYLLPEIGGSPENDDVGHPVGVPNYYLNSHCWTDTETGGWLGVAPRRVEDFEISFWTGTSAEGLFHADCRRAVNLTLEPGERWTSDHQPWICVYGFGPEDPEGWKRMAQPGAAWKDWLDQRAP